MDMKRDAFERWLCESPTGPLIDPMWLCRDTADSDKYGIIEVQGHWENWQRAFKPEVLAALRAFGLIPESDDGR